MDANKAFDHYRQHLSRMVKPSTREDYNKRLSMLSKYCAMHSISAIFSDTFRPTYREELNFTVEKDFSDLEASATFLCYLAGHAHCDWCGHLPDYPDQLILDVTRADTNAVIGTDDVDRSEITYAANKVTFDLTLRKIVVERIGSTSLVGGGTRSKIEFGF